MGHTLYRHQHKYLEHLHDHERERCEHICVHVRDGGCDCGSLGDCGDHGDRGDCGDRGECDNHMMAFDNHRMAFHVTIKKNKKLKLIFTPLINNHRHLIINNKNTLGILFFLYTKIHILLIPKCLSTIIISTVISHYITTTI